MFKALDKFPLNFKKALVKDLLLSKEEIILQTVYNNKCQTLKNLWMTLPLEDFTDDVNSKSQLSTKYLEKMIKSGHLIRDRASNMPQYKKSGYAVDIKKAYEDRLPYTLMGLDPLPPLNRVDYIFHLFLYKEPELPYRIFSEDLHEYLDKLFYELISYKDALEPGIDLFGLKSEKYQKILQTGMSKDVDRNTQLDVQYKLDAFNRYRSRIEKYLI